MDPDWFSAFGTWADVIVSTIGIFCSALFVVYEVKKSDARVIESKRPRFAPTTTEGYESNFKGKTIILFGNISADKAIKIASHKNASWKINLKNITENVVLETYVAIYYHFQNNDNLGGPEEIKSELFEYTGLQKGENLMLVPDCLIEGDKDNIVYDKLVVRFLSQAREVGFMTCSGSSIPNNIGPEHYYYVKGNNRTVSAAGIEEVDEMIKTKSRIYNKLQRSIVCSHVLHKQFARI